MRLRDKVLESSIVLSIKARVFPQLKRMRDESRWLPVFRLTVLWFAGLAVITVLAALTMWGIINSDPETVIAGANTRGWIPVDDAERWSEKTNGVSDLVSSLAGGSRPPIGDENSQWFDNYEQFLAGAEFERMERRRFEAQTWEVDLAKALDLKPDEWLERRSGYYVLNASPYPRIRVDRLYRMRPGAVPKGNIAERTNPNSTKGLYGDTGSGDRPAQDTETGPTFREPWNLLEPLGAPGGELVWTNAMVADHLIVQTEAGISEQELKQALPEGSTLRKAISRSGLYIVNVPADGAENIERAVLALSQLVGVVKFAEPDFVLRSADSTPNDPGFAGRPGPQWHLAKIMAPRGWDVLTGPPGQVDESQHRLALESGVIAIVDTGVDYTHPDLASALWTNSGECGGGKESNGIDDDGNGFIDDWRGYDFIGGDNDPMDDVGHGTHVAGIAGATGNNGMGVTGVCWKVKLLPLRIVQRQGHGTIGFYSGAVAAIRYINDLNANGRKISVANHSWGGNGYSAALADAVNNPERSNEQLPVGVKAIFAKNVNSIALTGNATEIGRIKAGMGISCIGIPERTFVTSVNGGNVTLSNFTTASSIGGVVAFSNSSRSKSYDVIHVAAAGNSRLNLDRVPVFPACLTSSFVVSVAASDKADAPALFGGSAGSNTGALNADLFAPGTAIWSTKWRSSSDTSYGYESRSGSSMAAPQVSGALALLRMWQPALSDIHARQLLIDQSEPIPALAGKCVSGGRLNVARIIDKVYAPILTGVGGIPVPGTPATSAKALSAGAGGSGLIAAGQRMTFAVQNGKVLAWGDNDVGQFGASSPQWSLVPLEVPGLNDVIMVAAGKETGYALKRDGTVWAWGNGNLAGAPVGADRTPAQIPSLSGVVWISSQAEHALAVLADGTVRAWGVNIYGQLGDGSTTDREMPVPVLGLADIVMADAGYDHSIALRADGTVFCWGRRFAANCNPLGDGVLTGQSVIPVEVPNIRNVAFVEAGNRLSAAVRDDGSLWVWGNSFPNSTNSPTKCPELASIISVSLASDRLLALTRDGRVFGMGSGLIATTGSAVRLIDHSASELIHGTGEPIVAVACGDKSSSIRTAEGNLYSFTSNAGGPEHGTQDSNFAENESSNVPILNLQGNLSYAFNLSLNSSLGTIVNSPGKAPSGITNVISLNNSTSAAFIPFTIVRLNGTPTSSITFGTGSNGNVWLANHFSVVELLNNAVVSDTADPDRDGKNNLLEYALGTNPKQVNQGGLPTYRIDFVLSPGQIQPPSTGAVGIDLFGTPTVEMANGKHYQVLTVNRNGIRQDVDYVVEVSSDLVNWKSGNPHTTAVLDTPETLEVYDTTSVEDVPQHFMRLRVQRK